MTTIQTTSPAEKTEIVPLLTEQIERLEKSLSKWEQALIIFIAITALAAVGVFIAEFGSRKVGKRLQEAKSALIEAKDKQLTAELAEKDLKIAEASDRAGHAEGRVAGLESETAKARAETAKAVQNAAEANVKAEGFRLDIAQANERAAGANRIAEQERLARLQLEARLADRIILPAQEQRLIAAFMPLKGKTVDVFIFGDTTEITQFSDKIIANMQRAGVLINVTHPLGGAAVRGVLVGLKTDAPTEFKKTAEGFIAILQEAVGNGVNHWDFDQLVSNAAAVFGNAPGAAPVGQSPLRVWIGSK